MASLSSVGTGVDPALTFRPSKTASSLAGNAALATPSALDRLLVSSSPLDRLLQTQSKLDLLVARGETPVVNKNPNTFIETLPSRERPSVTTEVEFRHLDRSSITPVRVHTVTQDAPYRLPAMGRGEQTGQLVSGARIDSEIVIRVRELEGKQLGTLDTAKAKLPGLLNAAAGRMNSDNVAAYGKTTETLRNEAKASGYYESTSHRAWAAAAEARTGGKVPAEWWIRNDPFGGTAGNGPQIRAAGQYPSVEAKIAMAHDTDWTLGRQFGAGPLAAPRTSTADATTMGAYGLLPANGVNPGFNPLGLYTVPTGHADWQVSFKN